MSEPRWWILRDEFSNRALLRDGGEKYPDDVNGKPSERWCSVVEYSAYEALKTERDEWKSEYENLCKVASDYENLRETLQAKLQIAVEALEFYSFREHMKMGDASLASTIVYNYDKPEHKIGPPYIAGVEFGQRARHALKQIRGE
ncbi:MAG: hypothetical protein V4493_08640 [Pseudomonadota bacterium]